MSNRLFHTLYVSLLKQLSTDEGAKEIAAEDFSDNIEEGIGQ